MIMTENHRSCSPDKILKGFGAKNGKMKVNESGPDGKPGYWAVIPAEVRYDEKLTPNAKLLYAEISSLAMKSGCCYAGNAYFTQNFGWSDRTVNRLISALDGAGYIRIEKAQSRDRRIYTDVNPFGDSGDSGDDSAENGGVTATEMTADCDEGGRLTPTEMSPNSDRNGGLHNNNIINKKTNRKNKHDSACERAGSADAYSAERTTCTDSVTTKRTGTVPRGVGRTAGWKPERFEGLWNFYPHSERGGKQAAIKAWDKLKPDDRTISLMGQGLKFDMAGDRWQRGIGIPNVSTYLNQRRWEDALERAAQGEEEGGWLPDPEVMSHE